jgi:uncharacterized Tic20 family protein
MCETMVLNVGCRLAFLMVLVLAFSGVASPLCVFAFSRDDALSAIADAEDEVIQCYGALSDADEAGANVTDLSSILMEAGELLSKANLAYGVGDFDSAVDFAVQSGEKLDGFAVEADLLRKAAAEERYWDFMINFVGSIVGTAVVICGGFLVWVFLKRKYEDTGVVV